LTLTRGALEVAEVTGTELEIVTPAATEIRGPEVDRLATLHTNERTDRELLAVWIKSHADGSPHTIRVYSRVGERFLGALAVAGSNLRQGRWRTCRARSRPCGPRRMAPRFGRLCGRREVLPGLCPTRRFHSLQRRTAHQAQEGAAPNRTAYHERGPDRPKIR